MLRAGLALGVLLLCAVLFVRSVEPRRLWAALTGAAWERLLAAVLLNLTLNLTVRVERWRLLLLRLAPQSRPSVADSGPAAESTGLADRRGSAPLSRRQLWSLYLAHLAANNLLPARAGEALRVVVPSRLAGYALSDLVAVLLVEKVIETLSMGLLAALLLLLAALPASLVATLRLTLGLSLLGLLLLVVAAWRGGTGGEISGRVQRFFRQLFAALRLLHTPRLWAGALVYSLLSIVADVSMIGLCLSAIGTSLLPLHWLLLFFAINLAIALPVTPGQVGVLEAGAVVALSLLGVGASEALAFALLYHACHVLPTTVLGGLAWWRCVPGVSRARWL